MARIIVLMRKHFQDPLYKNAYILMAREAATAVLGLVFWIVVARFYHPAEVGMAAALISAMGLLIVFSKLGLGFSLMRYLPKEEDKKSMINTCLTIFSGLQPCYLFKRICLSCCFLFYLLQYILF